MSLLHALSLIACTPPSDAPEQVDATATSRVGTAWSVYEAGRTVGEGLGFSVADAGDVNSDGIDDVITGAPDNDDYYTDAGVARVLLGGGVPMEQWALLSGEGANTRLGETVAGVGDLNCDGYDDVAVGSPRWLGRQGRVYIVYGGVTRVIGPYVQGAVAGDDFGAAIVGAGDINNDGCGDMVVGAPQYGSGGSGYIHVFLGSSSGLQTTPAQTEVGTESGGGLGAALASGDYNGDGTPDLVIGEPFAAKGHVKLFRGNGTGYTFERDLYDPVQPSFGYALSARGDVNNDGYDDLMVGSPYAAQLATDGGRVQLFLGSSGGLPPTSTVIHDGDEAGAYLGYSVAAVGDLENDGRDDIAVGSWGRSTPPTVGGAVFVLAGTPSGVDLNNPTQLTGNTFDGDKFGYAVSGGDYNGDGYSDVVVGEPGAGSGTGGLYIFQGYAQDDDLDGFPVDLDCDDENATIGAGSPYYRDSDRDTYGDVADVVNNCVGAPAGYVPNDDDCNDADKLIAPGRSETCDGIDQDCDGNIDEGLSTKTYYVDDDGDGFGVDGTDVLQCASFGLAQLTGDCDDGNANVNPGRGEVLENGVDDDCDPSTPDGDGDIDDDGISDADENALGLDPTKSDSDGDGRPDADELGSLDDPEDTDGDGDLDAIDTDDDGDGILSSVEGWDQDSDEDGVFNPLDLDSDDDGAADKAEGPGDFDADGIPNYLDVGTVTRDAPPDAPKLCGTATAPPWLGLLAATLLFRRRRSG